MSEHQTEDQDRVLETRSRRRSPPRGDLFHQGEAVHGRRCSMGRGAGAAGRGCRPDQPSDNGVRLRYGERPHIDAVPPVLRDQQREGGRKVRDRAGRRGRTGAAQAVASPRGVGWPATSMVVWTRPSAKGRIPRYDKSAPVRDLCSPANPGRLFRPSAHGSCRTRSRSTTAGDDASSKPA